MIELLSLVILILSLVGRPAPANIGVVELCMVALSGYILLLGLIKIRKQGSLHLDLFGKTILILVYLFVATIGISSILSSFNGTQPSSIIRSVTPYLVFLPLLMIGLVSNSRATLMKITGILLLTGILHALYQIKVIADISQGFTNLDLVYRMRTTFVEPRGTLALFLCPVFLLLPLVLGNQKRILKVAALVLLLVVVFGVISTQTRAQIVAIAIGALVFLVFHYKSLHGYSLKLGFELVRTLGIIGLVSWASYFTIPTVKALADSIIYRSQLVGDNGRIGNEWTPAYELWINKPEVSLLFGIGTGTSFVAADGDERPYIHNLLLYCLVYFGLVGFLIIVLLYLYCFRVFLVRAHQTKNALYLGFAALLASQFIYSLFFAVHKTLSYNATIAILIGVALINIRKDVLHKGYFNPKPVRQ